ncbi:uncharacterized protein LOC129755744 [Uranotaenia lowii]|uniref:uncharacterized protein LOC129755744 n=1 Tax=Uranotaenia lowii TaxID=190385 RepID=UPI00247938C8|nr:uncharacterized protein LOC129755744 [Uranotaenia lowii]XP_055608348.1 uncharacterized protein LOC129755744 [Uranotaenia lowii]
MIVEEGNEMQQIVDDSLDIELTAGEQLTGTMLKPRLPAESNDEDITSPLVLEEVILNCLFIASFPIELGGVILRSGYEANRQATMNFSCCRRKRILQKEMFSAKRSFLGLVMLLAASGRGYQ